MVLFSGYTWGQPAIYGLHGACLVGQSQPAHYPFAEVCQYSLHELRPVSTLCSGAGLGAASSQASISTASLACSKIMQRPPLQATHNDLSNSSHLS